MPDDTNDDDDSTSGKFTKAFKYKVYVPVWVLVAALLAIVVGFLT